MENCKVAAPDALGLLLNVIDVPETLATVVAAAIVPVLPAMLSTVCPTAIPEPDATVIGLVAVLSVEVVVTMTGGRAIALSRSITPVIPAGMERIQALRDCR